jgi:hypothetical protein
VTWPQIVILVGLCITMALTVWSHARNPKMSSGVATAYILTTAAFQALYAWVLHCGGFW